jgi:ketosteroid isomerase-like protein
MGEHPNLSVARTAWQAASAGDVGALRAVFATDVVWHATARGTPWEGTHLGPDAVIDHLARIGETVEIFDATLGDILISESRAAYVFEIRLKLGERTAKVGYQLLARIENGLVAEVWTSPLDPRALELLWH